MLQMLQEIRTFSTDFDEEILQREKFLQLGGEQILGLLLFKLEAVKAIDYEWQSLLDKNLNFREKNANN